MPPQGAPGGSGPLGTPRRRSACWAPSHCLGCSSQRLHSRGFPPPLTMQALSDGRLLGLRHLELRRNAQRAARLGESCGRESGDQGRGRRRVDKLGAHQFYHHAARRHARARERGSETCVDCVEKVTVANNSERLGCGAALASLTRPRYSWKSARRAPARARPQGGPLPRGFTPAPTLPDPLHVHDGQHRL